jgi:hypothetical protein
MKGVTLYCALNQFVIKLEEDRTDTAIFSLSL